LQLPGFVARKTARVWKALRRHTLKGSRRTRTLKNVNWHADFTLQQPVWILTVSSEAKPRRGEIWRADLGDGKKHAVVIVSLDGRNLSERASSVLVVPFGSYGIEGPTAVRMEPGETGLPEPSFLKAHFIQVLPKERLFDRLPRSLSNRQLRALVLCILRAVDPDAPYES
jgi:mRNA-degrading endonuclease toxin of MazEF toxin-antitoxin module